MLLCALSFYARVATAEAIAEQAPTPPVQNIAERAADAEAELTAKAEEQKNTVYSLRDFENRSAEGANGDTASGSTSTGDAANGSYATNARDAYAAEDSIERSLEGPDVVITAGADRTVYEYRQNGQLRMVKIIPRVGRPYYLVPADRTRGNGDLGQATMLLPQWTIVEF